MDPITAMALGEVGGSVLGDILGSGDREKSRRAIEAALQDIMGAEATVGPSAMRNVNTDPRLRLAQTSALDELQKVGREGGMDLGSRVALNEAAADTARRERGTREAILQDMARRGLSGSGAELAANLSNQQGGAERNAMAGARSAADARARALAAMERSGQLAGGIRGQDFGEGSAKATAEDERNRFNASASLTRAGMLANTRMGLANQAAQDAERWGKRGAGIGILGGYGANRM